MSQVLQRTAATRKFGCARSAFVQVLRAESVPDGRQYQRNRWAPHLQVSPVPVLAHEALWDFYPVAQRARRTLHEICRRSRTCRHRVQRDGQSQAESVLSRMFESTMY